MNTAHNIIVALALCIAPVIASAQTARSGGGDANAQLMQQMQQLASERTQLQAENAKLKKDVEDLKKQVKGLESEKGALSQRAQNSVAVLSRHAANAESLEENLKQQRERMEELVTRFREMATTLREVETESSTCKVKLEERDREFKTCADKNLALYKVNSEALDMLENQGVWTSLRKKEPFLQLKRVEIENLVDEYRGRADDQRVPDAAARTEVSPKPGG